MKCCTPNCIYFPQEVPPECIISERIVNGVKMRKVKRYCEYDNSLIKSWSHKCPRKDYNKDDAL